MAAKKKTEQESFEAVAFSKTEQFIERNQKIIMIVVLTIVGIMAVYWAYNRFYKKPLEEEAIAQMFVAQRYFEVDSFSLALNGDANYPGFLGIIEDYGSTKAGNLSNFYAGVCYMNLEQWDVAIEYFMEFKAKDEMLSTICPGNIGDAYVEKGDLENAIKYYKEATSKHHNNLTTPFYLKKLGELYEQKAEYESALAVYEDIFKNYSESTEARTIEKYIARVKIQLDQL